MGYRRSHMKKILFIAVLVLALFTVSASAEYAIFGKVFNPDGTSGTAATANSFATAYMYRFGINNQVGLVDPPGKIYDATGLATGAGSAFVLQDVGNLWTTAPVVGDSMVTVFEVYNPQFGWAGDDSYIAVTGAVITSFDINTYGGTDLPDTQLMVIPTPDVLSVSASQAVLGITGMNSDYINGYTLFRSTTVGGIYTSIGSVAQSKGAAIQVIDSGVTPGDTYYYKWSVNFNWGGGGGAPVSLTIAAKSKASGSALIPVPTSTFTATYTYTASPVNTSTGTPTASPTGSITLTSSATPSITLTRTPTGTLTFTYTITMTSTPVNTSTSTAVNTPTNTAVNTSTNTPVNTRQALSQPPALRL
jgi:hypothetical protein